MLESSGRSDGVAPPFGRQRPVSFVGHLHETPARHYPLQSLDRQADHRLKTIPTVILTTSDAEADIAQSYQLRANCYLSKPVQLDAFESVVKSINDFWLTKVKLPQQTLSG